MCVEGRLKQEKIQGCWFVDGKVPSIRMQVKWETFTLISFLNNVIESAKQKQKKNYSPCNFVLRPLLELLKRRRSGKIDQNLNFVARVEKSISFIFCS